jgi:tagaturonate epimerase
MTQRSTNPSAPPACVTLGLSPSFGFGDRTGLATPGHVEAMRRGGAGIEPIFPQQSIREMARTGRTPRDVMDDALDGMRRAGWTGRTGADADHLKTTQDVGATAAVGFTFFTIDPSAHVDAHADDYDEETLRTKFATVAEEVGWVGLYRGKMIKLATGTAVELTEEACLRAAVKYGRALNHALALADHIRDVNEKAGRDFEIELSVDETEQPTTLAEHYIIADQCLARDMKLVSLAPRYVGDFEKGVDYKGDVEALERSLRDHAAIAEMLGPYKLSLHSGSDKISMYPALARATRGRYHVKTAGTSYLEALRVVARHDAALFRRIVDLARTRYDTDKATYHVSATLGSAPPASEVRDAAELERLYLENWADVPKGRGFTNPGRQILHCTFGSTLTDPGLGPAIRHVLEQHPDTYTEVLADHFVRHLEALKEC